MTGHEKAGRGFGKYEGDDMRRLKCLTRAHRICQSTIGILSLIAFANSAMADGTTFAIDPQDLASALKAFAVQSHREIFFAPELARGRRSNGVKGKYDDLRALNIILEGTGLDFSVTPSDAILIRVPAGKNESSRPTTTTSVNESADPPIIVGQTATTRAQVADDTSSQGSSITREAEKSAGLSEIIVTAQKKSERLQDVPVALTALDAQTLVDNNQVRLQDYFATVPGLTLNAATNGNAGTQSFAIRGITTGASNPTVGVTIDDVPYGSSTQLANGELFVPDIDPSDLSQVEVLRGPQGTLYGASSIGGLIKFVTAVPSTDQVSGRVQVMGDDVLGGGAGYAVRGDLNVPLSDTVAIRASGFARQDPGYIENVITGQRNVNEANVTGGLFSSLWHPVDAVSLKLNALIQDSKSNGVPFIDANSSLQPTLGDLKQAQIRGAGGYDLTVRLYTATLKAKLGNVDFVSISGYGDTSYATYNDESNYYSYFASTLFGVSGATCRCLNETEKFTQEFRLSAPIGHSIEWLFGAFYTHENSPADEIPVATNPATGALVGSIEDFDFPTSLLEYAVFGDLTVHFTDQFNVQFGARESWNRQTYNETDSGPITEAFYSVPSPLINPTERTSASSSTYLLTPQFKISPDLMVYVRFATGYRIGGPNFNAVQDHIPVSYAPDTTKDYDLGIKGDFLDHTVSVDASLYYIDWHDIQLGLVDPVTGFQYIGNGGTAKSQGIELSLQARPLEGLTITAADTFSDAVLTQNLPRASTAIGFDGDRLPFSSRYTSSVSAQQDIPLAGGVTGVVAASAAYVGSRLEEFPSTPTQPRLVFPSYVQANARIGARYESWTSSLFVNNIFNKRGIVGGDPSAAESSYYVVYIQPLTVGLSITRRF
jgi:iron complex outermembrane recepter protein